ncbi:MAG: hypothetical protein ACXVCP_14030 [Bdellovibrio sp.]
MKTVLMLLTLLISNTLFAYQPIITCDNGAAVIDRYKDSNGKTLYQLVIRDENIKNYFNEQGIFGNKKSEYSNELIVDGLNTTGKSLAPHVETKDLKVYIYTQGPSNVAIFAYNLNNLKRANWVFQNCHN